VADRLKVAIVPPMFYTIPPEKYGGEIFCWDLAVGLSKLDVEVHLFGIPGSQPPPNGYLHYLPREDWSNFAFNEIKPATIYRKLLLEEVDVLADWTHMHWLADFRYWRGDGHAVSTPWGNVILRPLVKRNLVCWSRFQRDLAVKQFGFPETTKYVWGGTNTDFYCPDPDRPYEKDDYILWFARMNPSKRPDIVYELARRFPNQRFIVAGSFSASPDHAYYGAFYKQAFEKLPNVKILPDVSHEEKRELYRRAKALLFPSVGEAFGLVLVEALACGCPAICSRDGAFPEIIVEGRTGFLCSSLEEYERALRNVDMLSPEECRRDALLRWSRERAAREYLEIYRKVADGESF
jgi:glycosyltransferase involved in cell wall biosynthesis